MIRSRKRFAAALATGLTAALVLAAAIPTSAHEGIFAVRTADPNPGGEAHLYHTSDGWVAVRACDIQKDRYSVYAEAHFGPGGSSVATLPVSDTNGPRNGKNGCGRPKVVAPDVDQRITVKVCLKDRNGDQAGKKNKGKCRFVERGGVVV
jgi:hypothetical protein